MKLLLPLLSLGLTLTLVSCNDSSNSKPASAAATATTSAVSVEESKDLKAKLMSMFKNSVATTEYKNGNCVATYKDFISNLRDDSVQSITYSKSISYNISESCEKDKFGPSETSVQVFKGSSCTETFEKNGDIVLIKDCDGLVTTINMKNKTASIVQDYDGGTYTVKLESIAINNEDLKKQLENVKISYFEENEKGEQVEQSTETGNAITLLNLDI